MSFMRLLAAGRSIMGIKKQPGPYRMNQDNLLPKFASVPKVANSVRSGTVSKGEARPDSEMAARDSDDKNSGNGSGGGEVADKRNRRLSGPTGSVKSHGVLTRLASRLTRWGRAPGKSEESTPIPGRAIQGELSLETVKVVRNDLSEAEFGTGKGRSGAGQAGRAPLGMVWNRLSARLLRQAAQEFTLVQKERGKLLSQAGPSRGSSGGA